MTAPDILVIDNVDSFTFMLVDYLRALGADVRVERSDAITVEQAIAQGRDGIVISPGPGTPTEAGISIDLATACVDQGKPFLGVCLGHQALGLALGMPVERTYPVHGKVALVRHDGTGLFRGLPSPMEATRYHSLAVSRVEAPLIPNAWSEDGAVMAMRHCDRPAHGVQFHPESIATAGGKALLANFLKVCAGSA